MTERVEEEEVEYWELRLFVESGRLWSVESEGPPWRAEVLIKGEEGLGFRYGAWVWANAPAELWLTKSRVDK